MNRLFKTSNITIFCFLLTAPLLSSITLDPEIRHAAMAHVYAKTEYQEGFTEHIKIKTSHGYQSISTLHVNDFINSTEISHNYQKVILIENGYIPYYFEITTSHGTIQAAPAQQFYDEYLARWIQAKNLTTNDHIGTLQVTSVTKIKKFIRIYRINTSNHIFIIDGDIKVHNVNLAMACDIGLIVGQIVIQHPVLKIIQTGISLARFACRLQKQAKLAQQYAIEELSASVHESNTIEIRNYYETKRTQLLEILTQYQAMKNITETISKRTTLGSSLFANISPYQSNISLLPALSIESKYNATDQQKLLIAREQDLASIEQKIITIQISIAIYLNELIELINDLFNGIIGQLETSLLESYGNIANLKTENNLPLMLFQSCNNTITSNIAVQHLEYKQQELSTLLQILTQQPTTLLFRQSSNVANIYHQQQDYLQDISAYLIDFKSLISDCFIVNDYWLQNYPVISQNTLQNIASKAQQHFNEKEQHHNANIRIKQSQAHYQTPPNDPDPDDDENKKNKKYDHTNHPHDDTKNQFPSNEPHGLRHNEGHLPDTPEHRLKLLNTCRNRNNRIALDRHGNMWYAKNEPDGSQLWISVRLKNSEIQNCGLNKASRPVDPNTGLCKSLRPTQGKK